MSLMINKNAIPLPKEENVSILEWKCYILKYTQNYATYPLKRIKTEYNTEVL